MLVLNMGVPRSGTVWVHNIVREIHRCADVESRSLNPSAEDMRRFFSEYTYDTNVILHAHKLTSDILTSLERDDVVGFFNLRDPRDVVVSLMQLHGRSFEDMLLFTVDAYRDCVASIRGGRFTLIPYDHLVACPDVLVFQIARQLGYYLQPSVVKHVVSSTSAEVHRREMVRVQATSNNDPDIRSLQNTTRRLKESRTTLINDRHIQSGHTGRWRSELTSVQRDTATHRLQPFIDLLGDWDAVYHSASTRND